MKQIRRLFRPATTCTAEAAPPPRAIPRLPRQALASWGILVFALVLIVVAVLDPAMREQARTLDPHLKSVFRELTHLGNGAWPIGLSLAALVGTQLLWRRESGRTRVALRRVQACLWFVLASVALSGLTANLLKNSIGRARPSMPGAEVLDFTPFAFHAAQASFPSGHSTTAVAMMVAVALIVPRFALGAVSFGALIALSRCMVGVHWLSDVIAGAALGTVVTLALHRRFDGGRGRPMLSPAVARLLRAALGRAVLRGGDTMLKAVVKAVRVAWRRPGPAKR